MMQFLIAMILLVASITLKEDWTPIAKWIVGH
jgi:hypothetical protein